MFAHAESCKAKASVERCGRCGEKLGLYCNGCGNQEWKSTSHRCNFDRHRINVTGQGLFENAVD